jgi:hypothetical protein
LTVIRNAWVVAQLQPTGRAMLHVLLEYGLPNGRDCADTTKAAALKVKRIVGLDDQSDPQERS